MSGPLTGLTIVEMAAIGPVPLAGQLMADQGARVILIDRKSATYSATEVNRRNKQSVAFNLKTEAGVQAARRLINSADILIEGFRPGVMEKLGLGPDTFETDNPGLIFGRMTGWGQTGPLSPTAGHDLNYLAITGALQAIGHRDRPPVPPLNLAADYGGGAMFLIFGVLAALHERGQSGRGQVVDVSMSEGVLAMMSLFHSMTADGRWTMQREANLLDGGAPFYRCYATSDGKYMSVGSLEPQFFAELVALAGFPPDDIDKRKDPANWPDLHRRYEAVFATKTRAEWDEIFRTSDACVAPIMAMDEAADHAHNAERGSLISRDGVLQAAPAPRFSRSAADQPELPLAAGSSTDTVLRELGYSSEEITNMHSDGVLT